MNVELSRVVCPYNSCGGLFWLPEPTLQKIIDSAGEIQCPTCGRTIVWGRKTKYQEQAERLKAQLEEAQRSARNVVANVERSRDRAAGERNHLLWTLRTCPLCKRKSRKRIPDHVIEDLRDHLVRDHNATIAPVALLPEKT